MDFTLADHVFTATLPNSDDEPLVWTLVITRGDTEVRRETIPLTYRPIFGPDMSDMAALDERVEEIIKELGLDEVT